MSAVLYYCFVSCSQNDDLVLCVCMMSYSEGEAVGMVSSGSVNLLNLGKQLLNRGRRFVCFDFV